jgi:DNA-binding XRE family transcriptional regulator
VETKELSHKQLVGRIIAGVRGLRNLQQETLGQLAGISRRSVSLAERGQAGPLVLGKIEAALNLNLRDPRLHILGRILAGELELDNPQVKAAFCVGKEIES